MLDYNPFTETNIPKSNSRILAQHASSRNYFPVLPSRVQKPGFLISNQFEFSNVTDSNSNGNHYRYDSSRNKRSFYTENPFLKSHLLQDTESYSRLTESVSITDSGQNYNQKIYLSNAKQPKQNGGYMAYNPVNYYADLSYRQTLRSSNSNMVKASTQEQNKNEQRSIKQSGLPPKQSTNNSKIQNNTNRRNSQTFGNKNQDNQNNLKVNDGKVDNDQVVQAFSSKGSATFPQLQKPTNEDDPMNYNYPTLYPSLNMKGKQWRDSPQSPTWGNKQRQWRGSNDDNYFRNSDTNITRNEYIPQQIMYNGRDFYLISTLPLDQL